MISDLLALALASLGGAVVGGGAIALYAGQLIWRVEGERDDARTHCQTFAAEAGKSAEAVKVLIAAQGGLERERDQADRSARQALEAAAQWQARHAALVEQLSVLPERDPATGRLRKRERAS